MEGSGHGLIWGNVQAFKPRDLGLSVSVPRCVAQNHWIPLNQSHSICTSQTQPAKNKFWCSFFSFTQLTATSDKQNAYMNQHTPCFICTFASSPSINISSYMWVSSSVQLISTTQYILNSFLTLHYLHFPFPLLILLGQSKNKHFKPSQNMWSIYVLT